MATLLSASLLLLACVPKQVHVKTLLTSPVKLDTIALILTSIGPVFQPTLPLLDAAVFNAKTNDIADLILDEEEGLIEEFRGRLLSDLRRYVPAAFVTAQDFESLPFVDRFRTEKVVQTDNKNFPVAFFVPGDLNILTLDNGKSVDRLFESTPIFTERVKAVAKATGAQTILMSYSRLAVLNAGYAGDAASLRLETHLFLFTHSGRELIEVYGVTRPTMVQGKDPRDYSFQLSQFKTLSDAMAKELAKYIRR